MTEAYTYYDMCRRVNAGVPAGRCKVEINDWFFAQREKTMAIEDRSLLKDLREFYFDGKLLLPILPEVRIDIKKGCCLRGEGDVHSTRVLPRRPCVHRTPCEPSGGRDHGREMAA
jgi:hypothetical protein